MKLDLLRYKDYLRIINIGSKAYVFDPIRKKNIVLTPEEMTRQLLIHYLVHAKNYRPALIQVEKAIEVNGFTRRYDLIVFDRSFRPFLLVECKSHKIKINQATFDQITRYNLSLKVNYLIITNGMEHHGYKMNYAEQKADPIFELPDFQ